MNSTNITSNGGKKIDEEQSVGQNSNEQATSSNIKTQYNIDKELEETVKHSNSLNELSTLKDQFNDEAVDSSKAGSPTEEIHLKIPETSKSLNDLSHRLRKPRHEDLSAIITSYMSIDMTNVCGSERPTDTEAKNTQKQEVGSVEVPTTQEPGNRQPNIIIITNRYGYQQPPPPYQYSEGGEHYSYRGMAGQTPVYQTQNMGFPTGMSPDPNRSHPGYRLGTINIESPFTTRAVRNKFISKVYFILAVQLLFTFGFIMFCIHERNTREFVKEQWVLMIHCMILVIVLYLVLFCYVQTRRMFPFNVILLSLFTLSMAYLMAALSCTFDTKIVMISMAGTAVSCLLLSLLAWQRWFDLTHCGTKILVAFTIIVIYGIFAAIMAVMTRSPITYIIFACLITLLFCVYLMYDTQQILGGHRIEISPEEHILAAITLYVDIMVIFHYIVVLASYCK